LELKVRDLQENVLKPRLLRRMKEDVEKSIPLKEEVAYHENPKNTVYDVGFYEML
jgi:SNF2 family DNA or RNA helicase